MKPGLAEPSLAPEASLPVALDWALAHAARAPSELNSQPWSPTVEVGADGRSAQIALRLDPSRLLRDVDPDAREAVLACGGWLLNLRLGMSAAGLSALVRTCPDASQPNLLALVDIAPVTRSGEPDRDLRRAVFTRATHRAPFEPSQVPAQLLDHLQAEAAREGALVAVLDDRARQALTSLTTRAGRVLRRDAAFQGQVAAWSRPNGSALADGVPGAAHGLRSWQAWLEPTRLRHGMSHVSMDEEAAQAGDLTATLLVVGSADDGWASLLRAGAGMQRLLLSATVLGLAASFYNAALHVPAMRASLGRAVLLDHPQVAVRVGWGLPGAPTPRRI